jgi:hypothetical protein
MKVVSVVDEFIDSCENAASLIDEIPGSRSEMSKRSMENGLEQAETGARRYKRLYAKGLYEAGIRKEKRIRNAVDDLIGAGWTDEYEIADEVIKKFPEYGDKDQIEQYAKADLEQLTASTNAYLTKEGLMESKLFESILREDWMKSSSKDDPNAMKGLDKKHDDDLARQARLNRQMALMTTKVGKNGELIEREPDELDTSDIKWSHNGKHADHPEAQDIPGVYFKFENGRRLNKIIVNPGKDLKRHSDIDFIVHVDEWDADGQGYLSALDVKHFLQDYDLWATKKDVGFHAMTQKDRTWPGWYVPFGGVPGIEGAIEVLKDEIVRKRKGLLGGTKFDKKQKPQAYKIMKSNPGLESMVDQVHYGLWDAETGLEWR